MALPESQGLKPQGNGEDAMVLLPSRLLYFSSSHCHFRYSEFSGKLPYFVLIEIGCDGKHFITPQNHGFPFVILFENTVVQVSRNINTFQCQVFDRKPEGSSLREQSFVFPTQRG